MTDQKRHPRHGYTVAVYLGRSAGPDQLLLIEVYEQYNIWADENSKSYHYWPYDLSTGKTREICTIGSIGAPDEGHLPPDFIQGRFPGMEWTRLR